jgi:hypothetical protein
MLLLIPALIALAIALLQGRSPRGLAELPLRGAGFIMSSLVIQAALYLPHLSTAPLVLRWGGAIYIAALALALCGALLNWRLGTAARVATLGLALNATVIVANGGYMPVNAAAMRAAVGTARVREIADLHVYGNTRLVTRSTRLAPLSDVIPVPMPGGLGNVYSLGDALIAGGVAALVYGATRRREKQQLVVKTAAMTEIKQSGQ